MRTYKASFTYEVRLGEPMYVVSMNEADITDGPSFEDIEASWGENEADIVYAAIECQQQGDQTGFIHWGTDENGKWTTENDDEAGWVIRQPYGKVQFYVKQTMWDYEGAETSERIAERDAGRARIIAEIVADERESDTIDRDASPRTHDEA